ncbi:MAG TPA: putative O-glycosylation ligase, exosortase A system-associated [Methylomirabilota bacterium]|nr:putative O-glycosylation ligase, exosortase A system-associated [Methylomirabilota bacterium]
MGFRDLILTVGLVGSIPACFFRPWIGILVWSLVSYMNPHRLTYGFAYDFPFAQLIAIATLSGFVLSGDRKRFLWTREIVLVVALGIWFTITTVFAVYPESAWAKWSEVSKILLMALLVVPLFQDRGRLRRLLVVIGFSLGFYGVKAGVFALATGGRWMVLGPPGSFFEANNEMALVLNMTLPILFALAREEEHFWRRRLLWMAFGLTAVAVPFTYSRAGVLGLVVVLAFLFLKARRRLLLLPILVVAVVGFVRFAPEAWTERMQTLENVEADESAQLRFMSWRVGYRIASDRPVVGGGFKVFVHRETYDIYLPEYPRPFGHDAHSIYFNLLGEHGWIGLGLYVVLIGSCFATLRRLRKLAASEPRFAWMSNYTLMLQACLATYLVNGAFISAAYFDLAFQLIILVGLLNGLSREPAVAAEPAPLAEPARVTLPVTRSVRLRTP